MAKAVYLHAPKTGGSWVVDVLGKMGLKSRFFFPQQMADVPHFIQPKYLSKMNLGPSEKPFIFTFVREPISWYESWWRYTKMEGVSGWGKNVSIKGHSRDRWHPTAVINSCLDSDFNTTMENIIDKFPGFLSYMFANYTLPEWVDFVGKQESLREDLEKVLEILNCDYDRDIIYSHPKQRVTKGHDVSWDKDLKKEMKRLEYSIYRRFGYEKT